MAAGDEKIDVFCQVMIKNRLTDAGVEILFDGRPYTWKAGETRSIPKAYASHFLHKSTYQWDPTEATYPARMLVEVDTLGEPVERGASASPLTKRDTDVLDLLDESNLPADRYLSTDADGNSVPAVRKEYRATGINPNSGGLPRRINQRNPQMREEVAQALAPAIEPTE